MNIFKTRKFFTLLIYVATSSILPTLLDTVFYSLFTVFGFSNYDYFLDLSFELSYVVAGLLFIIISFYYLKDVFIENWKRLKFSKHFFITVIGTTYLLYILSVLTGTLAESLTGATDAVNQEIIIESMNMFPILNIISVVIIAPIAEEIVFRFAMIKFKSKYKYILLIISSLIFGLLHIHGDYIYLIDYALFGFVMGLIYLKTGNIWYPISIHFLNNLLAAIGMLIP